MYCIVICKLFIHLQYLLYFVTESQMHFTQLANNLTLIQHFFSLWYWILNASGHYFSQFGVTTIHFSCWFISFSVKEPGHEIDQSGSALCERSAVEHKAVNVKFWTDHYRSNIYFFPVFSSLNWMQTVVQFASFSRGLNLLLHALDIFLDIAVSRSLSHVNSADILWTLQCKHGHLSLSHSFCVGLPTLSHSEHFVVHYSTITFPLSHTHTLCSALISLSLSQSAICSPVRRLPLALFPSPPFSLALLCCQGKIHPAEHHAGL